MDKISNVRLAASLSTALVLSFLVSALPLNGQPPVGGQSGIADTEKMKQELERRKLELEARRVELEEQALLDARSEALWTRLAIVVPIVLGFATLWWQARTAYKVKELESNVAFQLKAAEVVLSSKSTKAGEERARALHRLFPERITKDFIDTFDKSKFKLPGMAYQEKKLELFKALSGNLEERRDIFHAYAMLYADEDSILGEFLDKWEKVYPEDADWVSAFKEQWLKAFPEGRWLKPDWREVLKAPPNSGPQPDVTAGAAPRG